jgi:hypothetical protein
MSVDYVQSDRAKPRSSLTSVLLLAGLAFLAGILLMGWVLSRWDRAAQYLGIAPAPVVAPRAAPPPVRAPVPVPTPTPGATPEPERLVIDPEISRRVAQLEQRIALISDQSRAAVGNADRAEGLLLAFAARRALDRGVSLGYLEGLLQQRFGQSNRVAVATVITASRQPITLEELQAGLQEVGPDLTGAGPDQDWWTALKGELGNLVRIRREGTPSTLPSERLQRATRRLDAGQVDVALAEVLRIPNHPIAGEWIRDARRYIAARRALDTIETAALLDPRNPPAVPLAPVPAPAPAPRPS